MRNNQLLISGAVVFKRTRNGKIYWLIVKQGDDKWEIPKVTVRKGESSVRASLRMMGEQAGMNARVLEEAGRSGGSTTVNGKVIPRRHIYYLIVQKSVGEIIGFNEHAWHDYKKAMKALSLKKEKEILKQAKKELDLWMKERNKKK